MRPRTSVVRVCRLVLPSLAVALASLPSSGAASAQVPSAPPTFPSSVELVTVDAVVLDREGQPVSGLTKDDFVVTEDGRPRDVVSFDAFDVSAPRDESEAAGVVASNEPAASDSGRAFAIVVDDLRIAPEWMTSARETAAQLLSRSVRDGDLVTLATTSGDAWWSARVPEGRADLLAVLARARGRDVEVPVLDRMSDYEAFWITNHEDSPGSTTARVVARWELTGACPAATGRRSIGCDGRVRARAAQVDGIRRDRLRSTLACVRRGIEALAPVRGRKSLLLLSEGFLEDSGSDARAVAALSREANTAVYFLDVRGLVALPGLGSAADAGPPPSARERFEETTVESAGAVALAYDTGGFSVRNTNDLPGGVRRIAAEARVFYLLGFHPPEDKDARRWRKLRVEVKRPGLTVRARRGYTLRSELASRAPAKARPKGPAADPVLGRALDSAHSASGIPLRAIAYVLEPRPKDTVHVLVAAELDAGGLGSGAPRARRLEVSVVALLRDTGRGFRHDDTVAVTATKADEPRWRALTREFELPPGVAQIRVVVLDRATGTIGSVSQRIEIPSTGEFRVSTPILTDRVEPPAARGQLPQPALAAHRVFPRGGGLYCQYEVFGAARPGGAPPRVSAGFELRAGAGEAVRKAGPTPIAADAGGRLVRLLGASLQGLDGGAYELVLEVQDEASGNRLERREVFVLAPDGR